MIETRPVWKYHGGAPKRVDDDIAIEEPLEVRVRGKSIAVTMRTPGNGDPDDKQDAELAVGFLMSEGLIRSADDIARIDPCTRTPDGNIINVFLVPNVTVDFDSLSRNVFASSSCGICGKATIDSVHQHFPPLPPARSDLRISQSTLSGLPGKLRNSQPCFDRTGGLHAAGLFDPAGNLIALREDVGRHNAVDKLLGYALLNGMTPLGGHLMVVSGRASFEIVQKALAAGVPLVAAVSAPSSLAVQLAEESGMTLVGFLRDHRMNVYCGEERVSAN